MQLTTTSMRLAVVALTILISATASAQCPNLVNSECRDGWAWFGLRHDGANIAQGQSITLNCTSTITSVETMLRVNGFPNGGVPSLVAGDPIRCTIADASYQEIATAELILAEDNFTGWVTFDFSSMNLRLVGGQYMILAYTNEAKQCSMGFCTVDSYDGGNRQGSNGGGTGPWTGVGGEVPFRVNLANPVSVDPVSWGSVKSRFHE